MPLIILGSGKGIEPRELTVVQSMRLGKLLDLVRAQLGVSRAAIAGLLSSGAGAGQLASTALTAVLDQVDLDSDELPPLAAQAFKELGALWGLTPAEVGGLTLGEAAELGQATWEANASGPLGQRLKALMATTIATFGPNLSMVVDAALMRLTSALMTDPLAGGTSDGGTTASSSPSPTPSDGTSTPSEDFPFDGPSSSLQESNTAEPSEGPSSEPPTPETSRATSQTLGTPSSPGARRQVGATPSE